MLAFMASRDMAAAISACLSQLLASYRNNALIAVNTFEPFIVANPSLAWSPGIGIPALSIASFPSYNSP